MPFKIRLKKTKRYNVSSKNAFVASVQLLDNTILGCTLGGETTGFDCLANVASRIGLTEVSSPAGVGDFYCCIGGVGEEVGWR